MNAAPAPPAPVPGTVTLGPVTRSSSPRTPTRASVVARRQQILDAATVVFAEKGILATTVRDIGDRVGMHSGSLYHHFPSKEAMIAAILTPSVATLIDAFDRIVATTDDPVEVLRNGIEAAVRQTAADPQVARILHQDQHHITDLAGLHEVVRARREMRDRIEATVERGIADGLLRDDVDPRITSKAVLDLVLAAFRHLPPLGTATPAQVAQQLSALLIDGLRRT